MTDLPWIVGIFLAIAYFAYFEWRAFEYPKAEDTLSRFIYNITTQFPLTLFWMGMFVGTLSSHFWWHWNPAITPNGVGG